MIQHGNPPYFECSSKGFKPFSAFYAKVNGKSIEERYQAFKIFDDGSTGLSWKEAKGKKAVNQVLASHFYSYLWDRYIEENPDLQKILIDSTGLSDMFGQPGHCCQATELWRIRENLLARLSGD